MGERRKLPGLIVGELARRLDIPTPRLVALELDREIAAYNVMGSFLDVAIDGAPGSPTACLIDVALRPPVALPPFMGQLHVRGFRIPTPPVDSSGSARVRLPIPNSPQLVGVYLVLQGALRDAQTGALQLTNAADAVIGS